MKCTSDEELPEPLASIWLRLCPNPTTVRVRGHRCLTCKAVWKKEQLYQEWRIEMKWRDVFAPFPSISPPCLVAGECDRSTLHPSIPQSLSFHFIQVNHWQIIHFIRTCQCKMAEAIVITVLLPKLTCCFVTVFCPPSVAFFKLCCLSLFHSSVRFCLSPGMIGYCCFPLKP